MHYNYFLFRCDYCQPLAGLAAVVFISLFGCKARPYANSQSDATGVEAQDGSTLNLSDAERNDYSLVLDESLAILNISKKIMGLNPDLSDKHDHIGLLNVADILGYDLPFNTCGYPWRSRIEGNGKQLTLLLNSDHNRGSGVRCREIDPNFPVMYSFGGWKLSLESLAIRPWKRLPDPKVWPKPTEASNANTASLPVATIDSSGQLTVKTKETTVASSVAHGDILSHHVKYVRSIRAEAMFTKQWKPMPYGVQIFFRPDEGTGFTMGPSETHAQQLTQVACSADILQPPNCHYRVFLSTEHVLTQVQYRGMVNLQPQIIGLSGRLRASGDCQHRKLRNQDGHCAGAMGADGLGVRDSFGKMDELSFADDLVQQVDNDAGQWFWTNVRSLPLAQNQGLPMLDWATRYFASGSYGRVALDFIATTESINSCTLHVEVMPGSEPTCASMQDGASVEPTMTPILNATK